MTRFTNKLRGLLAAAAITATFGSIAHADHVDLHQVLHGSQNCDHVIRLIMRHGVNNSFQTGGSISHSPYGPIMMGAADVGDLELIQITQCPHLDANCGPKFAIVIKNNSTREVCGLRVSMVALFGRIQSCSPTTTSKVEKICAGEAVEITMQLPIESLAMGNFNGQALPFQKLLVAIDSFDEFAESNEANNIKAWNRSEIPVAAETATVEPQSTAPTQTTVPTFSPPATGQQVTTQAATPATQNNGNVAAPAQGNDLQAAIDQLSQQSSAPVADPTL